MQPSFAFMNKLNSFDSQIAEVDKQLKDVGSSPKAVGETDTRIELIRNQFSKLTGEFQASIKDAQTGGKVIDLAEMGKIQSLMNKIAQIGQEIGKFSPAGKSAAAIRKMIDDTDV